MPDDPATRGARPRLIGWIPVLAAIGVLATAGAGGAAEGLSAKLAVQFQRVEQDDTAFGADSLPRGFTTSRSLWLQTYEVNHSARIGDRLRVLSQFRLTDMSYVDRPEGSRQPYGLLRVTHPLFGVTGSHRPTTTTGTSLARGFAQGGADSLLGKSTTRDRETALLAYMAVPRAPRVDVSWVRRSRDAGPLGSGGIATTRNARSSYAIGPLRMNGGYQDVLRDAPGPAAEVTDQRSLTGGAGLQVTPWKAANFDLSYNAFDTRRGVDTARPATSRSQVATLTGTVRQSEKTTWSTFYNYRRSDVATAADTSFDDHDASVTVRHLPTRIIQLTGTGGLRTERVFARADLIRYASGVASASGMPRRGWQGTASVSHVSNWSNERSPYSIDAARAASVFELRRDLKARFDSQISANSDSAARGHGTVSNVSAGIEARPWRSLTADLSVQTYQAGPGVFVARSRSRSEGARIEWQPLAAFQLMGYVSRTGALPNDDPRLTTQQWSARWSPGTALQLTGSYMKTAQSRISSDAQQISGREVVSLQLASALNATTRIVAGFSTADPGSERTSRQYDVTFTKSFGP